MHPPYPLTTVTTAVLRLPLAAGRHEEAAMSSIVMEGLRSR